MRIIIWLLALFLLSCARQPIKDSREAMRPASFSSFEFFDDLGFEELKKSLPGHVRALEMRPGETMQFGPRTLSKAEYLWALKELDNVLQNTSDPELIRTFLSAKFEVFEVYGSKKWGDVFITGYYEPVIEGSKKRTERFSQPLYALPKDMVLIDLAAFSEAMPTVKKLGEGLFEQKSRRGLLRGRLKKPEQGELLPKVVPYFTRQEIDQEEKLKNQGLELAWLDPIDAFFLHIQGSGTIRFQNGQKLRVGYAGQNGHSYVPIGKFLTDVIPLEEITQQKIENHLRKIDKEQMREFLNQNPSYVFFQKLKGEPLTHMGAEVVPGRTIATDHGLFPKGALAYLKFEKPEFLDSNTDTPTQWVKTSRFVFDQDTGGAIRGPGRVDLYYGPGEQAKLQAGVMKGRGELYYLVPKQEWLNANRQKLENQNSTTAEKKGRPSSS